MNTPRIVAPLLILLTSAAAHAGGVCIDWERIAFSRVSPGPRTFHAMAPSPFPGQTVLFGGASAGSGGLETWLWDGEQWSVSPAAGPSARSGAAMAYDAARGRTVLFGGYPGGIQFSRETWTFDGAAWTLAANSGPAGRQFHAMAYDSARAVTVLFGGSTPGSALADTWEWNGSTWTQRTLGAAPPARTRHAMAYDAARGVTVLFGGQNAGGEALADTWEFDGVAWTQVSAVAPGARSGAAMAWHEGRQRIVLIGGTDETGEPSGDVWEWDGQWSIAADDRLPPREGAAASYDALRDAVTTYGGSASDRNTWAWDGSCHAWRTDAPPPYNEAPPLVFVPELGGCILYGGFKCEGGGADAWTDETWLWTGEVWLALGQGPIARAGHDAVLETQGRLFVFGGIDNAPLTDDETLWSLSSSGGWQAEDALGPTARTDHRMSFDARRNSLVLFGGLEGSLLTGLHALDDLWEWTDSGGWSRIVLPGPIARFQHSFTFDHDRGTSILIGGRSFDDLNNYFGDIWSWDGAAWTEMHFPADSRPEPRAAHRAVYSHDLRGILLFGGASSSGLLSDLWLLDGSGWRQLASSTPPGGRLSPMFALDESRSELVVWGGTIGSTCLPEFDDLWIGRMTILPADLNHDGEVSFADLNILLKDFNAAAPGLAGDIDDDGDVDFADLNTLLAAFNTGCGPS